MSQDDVIKILENRQLSSEELEKLLNISRKSITHSLMQLFKYNEIDKEYSYKRKKYIYKKRKKKKKRGEDLTPLPK